MTKKEKIITAGAGVILLTAGLVIGITAIVTGITGESKPGPYGYTQSAYGYSPSPSTSPSVSPSPTASPTKERLGCEGIFPAQSHPGILITGMYQPKLNPDGCVYYLSKDMVFEEQQRQKALADQKAKMEKSRNQR